MLYIYHVSRRSRCGDNSAISYDETSATVVVAACAEDARRWAATVSGDEGHGPWLTTATVVPIGTALEETEPGVVLRAYHAG